MPPEPKTSSTTSDLYIGKSTLFKTFLMLGVAFISALFIWYSFRLIEDLKEDTRAQVERYAKLFELAINSPTSGEELQFIFDEIIIKATFPIIVLDKDNNPIQWRNVPELDDSDTTRATIERLNSMAAEMRHDNRVFPIFYGTLQINSLCYGDPAIIGKLKLMPFVEVAVVLAFMIVGIIGFQNIRRSEERLIWVGMAKETAHQLGTPISSLLGWLELMNKENRSELSPEQIESLLDNTVENMNIDVDRLQRVANRFGKIGSIPKLQECDLNELIRETAEYYRRRLPFEGKGTQIDFRPGLIGMVMLNPELFGWVLENLVKNGLQAVDPKSGRIFLETAMTQDKKGVQINIIDNGGGISTAASRKIFRPGFSTKKRSWGMGLTLVKRIVEEYHVGRVRLARSRPGETVFEIILPNSGEIKE
ncbi:MAG: HAMP domain-containing sensor histidine kinase [candidate division Zixibacteria bacterium]|nr:HAMP domain-containing sensor histidine kinase [candidate division Zixibacteria bacterium]